MDDHTWCHDVARDAAVRAAEDGRTGPLPTLEQAIARPFADAAERSVPVNKTREGQRGMRTERVSLEERITLEFSFHHRSNFRPKEWAATFLPGAVCQGISVRVVEDAVGSVDDRAYADRMGCDEERDFANRILTERDAAIRERDNERLVRIGTETDRDFARREKDAAIRHIIELRTERDKLKARVAELEAASGGGEGEPLPPGPEGQ